MDCLDNVVVTDGLITVTLDFGSVFSSGSTRWLQVSSRADSTVGNCATGSFTTLVPRQELTGVPTAIGLRLPFNGGATSSLSLLTLSNAGSGGAISCVSSGPQTIAGAATGTGNIGVYGQNTTSGSYGGCGYGATGVYGFSPTGSGVVGECASTLHAAVTGTNTTTSSSGYGGYFTVNASSGTAVYGNAPATDGTNYGVVGYAGGISGTGISGIADSATGSTRHFGVVPSVGFQSRWGRRHFASEHRRHGASPLRRDGRGGFTPNGYAGYFQGRGYFQDRVGVGLEQPAASLHVVGGSDLTLSGGGTLILGPVTSANLVMDPNEIQARNNGAASSLYINANGFNVGIGTGNAQGFQLAVNGSAAKPGGGSWSTLSDARLKKNVQPLTGALDKLLQLRGVTFEYIDPKSINELPGTRTGMIAQEVEGVMPDWVDQGPDGMRRVTFRGFEALTVEALRALHDRNEQLAAAQAETAKRLAEKDARIAGLEERLGRLEAELARLATAPKSPSPISTLSAKE